MPRPVCLFTGQWADLPLETLAAKAASFGYEGLELACWGDHFDVGRALAEDDYCEKHWKLLGEAGISSWAISTHLVGQATPDQHVLTRVADDAILEEGYRFIVEETDDRTVLRVRAEPV